MIADLIFTNPKDSLIPIKVTTNRILLIQKRWRSIPGIVFLALAMRLLGWTGEEEKN